MNNTKIWCSEWTEICAIIANKNHVQKMVDMSFYIFFYGNKKRITNTKPILNQIQIMLDKKTKCQN